MGVVGFGTRARPGTVRQRTARAGSVERRRRGPARSGTLDRVSPASEPLPSSAPPALAVGPAPVPYSGPTRSAERLLAPDLARGLALLGIALANCVYYIGGRDLGPLARPVDGTAGDRVADVLVGLFVDNRAFPLFTILFAYGFTVLIRRQAAGGVPYVRARALLLRRSLWLAVFGAVHIVLLFEGDILLSYGCLGVVLALLFAARDSTLKVLGWSLAIVFVVTAGIDGLPQGSLDAGLPGVDQGTFVGALLWRLVALVALVFGAPFVAATFVPLAVIGTLLGRRQVLERPLDHEALFRRLTLVGLPVGVLGAVPLVLAAVQVWQPPWWALFLLGVLHGVSGVAGALGFFGAVGWFVANRSRASSSPTGRTVDGRDGSHLAPGRHGPRVVTGPVVRALAAVGQRSLTCYLLQSVLFVPLLAPWALGLGVGAGTLRVSLIAVGVWLVTVGVAVALDRAGRAGPAEWLLRRLTYGR